MWAAYKNGSFPFPQDLTQEQFLGAMAEKFGGFDLLWVVEDDSKSFKSGRGLIAISGIKTDGWCFEPTAYFFKWATPKNVLRALVGFFQMMRYQKDVGVCKVTVNKKDARMLYRLKNYGVLFPRGRVPMGNPSGDEFIFSIQGDRK